MKESAVILFDEQGAAFHAFRFGDRRLIARDREMLRPALGIMALKDDSRLRHYSRGFPSSEKRSGNYTIACLVYSRTTTGRIKAGEMVYLDLVDGGGKFELVSLHAQNLAIPARRVSATETAGKYWSITLTIGRGLICS